MSVESGPGPPDPAVLTTASPGPRAYRESAATMPYKVVRQFGPQNGTAWTRYLEWSKLNQITDFCSLDSILNNSVFTPSTAKDWDNCVNEDFKTDLITNLEFALHVQRNALQSRIFGVTIDPRSAPSHEHFDQFLGYDIIDGYCDVSLLTNCGGFPDVFSNDLINQFGLIGDITIAYEVRDNLRNKYSTDSHAKACEVWAVYRVAP